jgi:hypothetical protein
VDASGEAVIGEDRLDERGPVAEEDEMGVTKAGLEHRLGRLLEPAAGHEAAVAEDDRGLRRQGERAADAVLGDRGRIPARRAVVDGDDPGHAQPRPQLPRQGIADRDHAGRTGREATLPARHHPAKEPWLAQHRAPGHVDLVTVIDVAGAIPGCRRASRRQRLHVMRVVDVGGRGGRDRGPAPAQPLDPPATNEIDPAGAHRAPEEPVHHEDPGTAEDRPRQEQDRGDRGQPPGRPHRGHPPRRARRDRDPADPHAGRWRRLAGRRDVGSQRRGEDRDLVAGRGEARGLAEDA